MITKGIVEEIIDKYNVRVRMPFYNKAASAPMATRTEDLYIASICALPNSVMNFKVGDIVFIGFEDHSIEKPVVLGQLNRENSTNQNPNINAETLTVNVDTYLSAETTIGDVKPIEIQYLQGVNKNLQFQLDILSQRVAKLEEQLNKLTNGEK